MPIDSKECFAALTEDGQLWEIYQAAQSGGGGITSINGDTTAAQLISGTAPITASTAAGTTTISTSMNTARLLGRTTAGVGVAEEITVGTGLSLTAGTLTNTVSAGVTSVTATAPLTSSGGATPDISTSIATNRIVGRSTAGTGVMEQLTPVGITVSGGNITGIGGTVGTVDNAVPRADGTGGYTVQGSNIVIADATTSTQRNVQIYNNHPAATSFAITAAASTDVITATGHTFVANDCVVFTALAGGAGLQLEPIPYFVRDVVAATSFKVALVAGGTAVDITSDYTSGSVELANSSLVLTPKGTGALIAQKPDGTTTGGNARGVRATDFQRLRGLANQVASGESSVICGGVNNRASSLYAIVVGGGGNSATGGDSPLVVGGSENQSNGSSGSTVVGGYKNLASGTFSSFVGAGGHYSGSNVGNTASGSFSAVLCGTGTLADRFGMQAHANGSFSGTTSGDAQRARFVLRCKTTTNAAVEMALDGSTTYLSIPLDKVMFMNIKIVGVRQTGADVATYERQYCVKNIAGTSSEVYAPITIGTDNPTGTTIALSANNADDTLRIAVTGVSGQIWRWVASIDCVEVIYGT